MREHGIADWRELIRQSQDDVEWFWDAVVRFLGIEFTRPYERVLDTSRGIEWSTWFGGGELNLTRNCVDRHPAGRPAVVWESEDGRVERMTYGELAAETNRLANALLELGVGRGDAVGLFLPMSIQAVAGFYAICKIGAIVVPIFSGFAAPAVAARLDDAGAVLLLTADAVPRRGRPVSMKAVADEALADAPSVRHVIVWDRLGTDAAMVPGRDHRWDELVARQSAELDAPALDAETPMMVIYTSGTTGRPKGAVHVHGGFLVKIAEEAAFQADVHADDRVMWVTDMGWIMGPWVVVGDRGRRSDAGRLRGRARLSRTGPAVGARRGPPDLGARRLADAHPRPSLARRRARARARPLLDPRPGLDGRAVEPRPVHVAARGRRASGGPRSSTSPAGPRWAPASSRRCRSCRFGRARWAVLRSAWRSTSPGPTAATSRPARSASWCAGSRGRR